MPLEQAGHWRLILMLACHGKPRTEAAVSHMGAKTGSSAAHSANRRFQSGVFKRNHEGVGGYVNCQTTIATSPPSTVSTT
jgi:hypothetical protein